MVATNIPLRFQKPLATDLLKISAGKDPLKLLTGRIWAEHQKPVSVISKK
jgi:hypothetical protein